MIEPEADSTIDCVAVRSQDDVVGKILHQLCVAAAEENGVADQGCLEALDHIEDGPSPALHTALLEAREANIFFVGPALLVWQVSEFKRNHYTIKDHC